MPMIKLRAPEDATGLSIAGTEYEVKDGFLEIPDLYKHVAESHGYGKKADEINMDRIVASKIKVPTQDQVAAMGRGELLIYCDEHGLEAPQRAALPELRAFVWEHAAQVAKVMAAAKKK